MAQTIKINGALLAEAVSSAEDSLWGLFPALQQWITGDKQPTVSQLAELAKKINIPFGYFFLKKLPDRQNTVPLFRTGQSEPFFEYSQELKETISVMEMRQDWLSNFLRSEGLTPLSFVGSVKGLHDIGEITRRIRIELNLPANWSSDLSGKDEALNYLIRKIENIGVYVMINGIVKNNTKKTLNSSEFKGFALCDPYAPFIFVNGQDFKAAQLFTLLHELVHVWLGLSSVSELNEMLPSVSSQEKICNAVAAELLVDKTELKSAWEKVKWLPNAIELLVKQFKVSGVVIGRRLFDLGIYNWNQYDEFYAAEEQKWKAITQKAGGGDFYLNQPNRVGRAFSKVVDYAARSGKLLYSDAYKLTNLYGETYHNFQLKN